MNGLARTLSEEFEGNVPNIEIEEETDNYFYYICAKTKKRLRSPCCHWVAYDNIDFKGCKGCLGLNRDFARYYTKYAKCSGCGMSVDFGYFIFIYLLEKAGLLPKNFKIHCCVCEIFKERGTEKEIVIDELIGEGLLRLGLEDGEERER